MGPSGGPAAAMPAGIFVFNLVVCVTRSTVFFNDFNFPAALDILIDDIRYFKIWLLCKKIQCEWEEEEHRTAVSGTLISYWMSYRYIDIKYSPLENR